MSGNTGQHITVKMVVGLPVFFVFLDAPHLKQIRTCAHIHTCDTLFAGEAVVLACFLFRKISEKSVEISPWFCYNLFVSLCSCAGVKNPRWQADT